MTTRNRVLAHRVQKGMATLAVTLLLLVAITLIVLYGGRVSVMKQKVLSNEVRALDALTLAERGIDDMTAAIATADGAGTLGTAWNWVVCDATAYTNANQCKPFANTDGSLKAAAVRIDPSPTFIYDGKVVTVNVSATCTDVAGDDTCDEARPGKRLNYPGLTLQNAPILINLAGQAGAAGDTDGSAFTQQVVSLYPLLSNPVDSPITVDGVLNAGGGVDIVTNADGNGENSGVPISIWTSEPVSTSGSWKTCQLGEYLATGTPDAASEIQTCNNCSCPATGTGFLSGGATAGNVQGIDILSSAADFPADVFEYVFGVPRTQWTTIRDVAKSRGAYFQNCATLKAGLNWVDTSECALTGTIGSIENPVMVVTHNVNIQFNANSRFYGVIFSFTEGGAAVTVRMNGGAILYGAVIADQTPTFALTGNNTIRFEKTVLSNLSPKTTNGIARLSGTWNDAAD